MRPLIQCVLSLALSLTVAQISMAEVRVAHVFQDNMVLQRDVKVPVWGWTDPGAKVTVKFAAQEKTASANDKGYWIVELDPMPANATGQALVIQSGSNTIERKDILIGEVWVLSGQSNMARPLRNDGFDFPFFKKYSDDAEYPQIRFIHFGFGVSSTPLDDVEPVSRKKPEPWQVLSKPSSQHVMSIGFFFAKKIHKDLNVPVGLVQVAVSGTPQTTWMAKETLEALPGEKGAENYYQQLFNGLESRLKASSMGDIKSWADFETALKAWRNDPDATERNWPGAAANALLSDYPSVLYNARVHPLAPFAFRGMLWHQGEAGPGGRYGERMFAMIQQHRKLFGNDFHFIFGTLTRNSDVPPPLAATFSTHAAITASMIDGDRLFAKDGKGTLVNFLDIGNTGGHWAMKEEAGRRMALAALTLVYGQKHLYTGPQLIEAKINGATATCTFRHVGEGLKFEPSINGISGVVVTGKDRTPVWAEVKVTAPDTLVITHPHGADISGIYYGAYRNPHETIFNSDGFTAFAFNTGIGTPPKVEQTTPLLSIVGEKPAKADMDVLHVRRNGYIVRAVEIKGPEQGTLKLRALIPAEWKGFEVRLGDKDVTPEKTLTENGATYIEIDAPINGASFIIAEKGQAETFAKIDRF